MDVSLYRFNLTLLNLEGPLSLRSGQRSLKSLESLKCRMNLYQSLLLHAACSMQHEGKTLLLASRKGGIMHPFHPWTFFSRQLHQLTLTANNIILCFSLLALDSNSPP